MAVGQNQTLLEATRFDNRVRMRCTVRCKVRQRHRRMVYNRRLVRQKRYQGRDASGRDYGGAVCSAAGCQVVQDQRKCGQRETRFFRQQLDSQRHAAGRHDRVAVRFNAAARNPRYNARCFLYDVAVLGIHQFRQHWQAAARHDGLNVRVPAAQQHGEGSQCLRS